MHGCPSVSSIIFCHSAEVTFISFGSTIIGSAASTKRLQKIAIKICSKQNTQEDENTYYYQIMYVLVSEYVTKQHLIDLSPITTKSCRSTDLISEYE
jgi:hypothetical protein